MRWSVAPMSGTLQPAWIALVVMILCNPVSAAAQPFIGGSFVVSWQPAGTVGPGDPSIPTNGLGGTGVGFGVVAGVFFKPRVALDVEFSVPSRFDGLQIAEKWEEQNSHRDLIFSGLLRFRSVRHGPEFVAGLSLVQEDGFRLYAYRNFMTGGYGPFQGSPLPVSRGTWGVTGGVDFPIPLNAHLSVVPQLRVHMISRESTDPNAMLGLSPVVFRPALALMATF
jgi:hypothetical protein